MNKVRVFCLIFLLAVLSSCGSTSSDVILTGSDESSASTDSGTEPTGSSDSNGDTSNTDETTDTNEEADLDGETGTDVDTDEETTEVTADVNKPNILLIISDDQGIDASAQYDVSGDPPNTPVLNSLAASGIVFDNAWATAACTTTRGSIITGKHGINSGIDRVPDFMETDTLTLQRALSEGDAGVDTAIIGKWHLSGGDNTLTSHPLESGVGYYAGNIAGVIEDYSSWPLTVNGSDNETSTGYHTSVLTDMAIDWIGERAQPWFLWLAYVAPHTPFHLPPQDLHSLDLSADEADIAANPRPYYLAAIEAMDTEIGRLIASLPIEDQDNTLIIFIGDNGTPAQVIDTSVFNRNHSKSSLYEGGIKVPMIVSGAGVTRPNQRETALVNSVDLFATVTDMYDVSTQGIDGISFLDLLSDADASSREYNYSEFVGKGNQPTGWTVRDYKYKLIELSDGTQELYDLDSDLGELNNLIGTSQVSDDDIARLESFGAQVRQE